VTVQRYGAVVSLLTAAPWRRAPLLLLRGNSAVVAALLFAGLILGAAAAATPLFLSSARNAALAEQLAQRCAAEYGFEAMTSGPLGAPITELEAAGAELGSRRRWPAGGQLLARRDATVRNAGARAPHLGGPVLTVSGPPVQLTLLVGNRPGATGGGRLLYRDGFLEHIRKLDTAPGVHGVWLPSEEAAQLGARPGDRIAVSLEGRTASARVAGVYKDLNRLAPDAYWCAQGELIYQRGITSEPPPPLVLADPDVVSAISRQLTEERVDFSWELPLDRPVTLAQARETAAHLPEVGRALLRSGGGFFKPARLISHNAPGALRTRSELPFLVQRSDAIAAAVGGAVGPVAVAGTGVALLLVAAAGAYWVDRRRMEIVLLAAKGVGPLAIAGKAVLEMLLWTALGGVLGWLAAIGLVRLLGPSHLLDPFAIPAALARTGAGLLVGLGLLGLVTGLRVRGLTERGIGARHGVLARLPWELAVLALAALAFRRLATQGPPVATGTEPPPIDLLLLAFPMLFLVGTVGLAARLLGMALRRLGTAGDRWPHAVYLAARRVAHGARLALLLVAASAMSIGVMAYAATITLSVRQTLDAKARTFVGSDTSFPLLEQPARVPVGIHGTVVRRFNDAEADGSPVDVLAIDPSTFGQGAFWDRSFAARSLPTLLGDLAPGPTGQPVPAVVVGRSLPDRFSLALSPHDQTGGARLQARVTERTRTFPGMRADPLVVVDRRAVDGLDQADETLLWARGPRERVAAVLERSGLEVGGLVVDVREVLDVSSFLATSWTFGFLQALGALTGLITAGGLVLYVESRQRNRRVAYALSRRMGLSRASHLESLLAEVGGTLLGGFAIGVGLSFLAARLVYRRLDVLPTVPPVPLLRIPVPTLAGTGLAVLAVAWLAAWIAQRSADRTNLAEVLRHAE
jgi:putative ABC transport system permease protein